MEPLFKLLKIILNGNFFNDSNMIISNTVNSSSNFSIVVQISTGNIDLIKQYTDTDSLIVDIVATDTSGNTVTQQDSLAL